MSKYLTETGEVLGAGNRSNISLDEEMEIRAKCREIAETTLSRINGIIETTPLLQSLFQIDPEAYRDEMEANLLQSHGLLTPDEAKAWKSKNDGVTTLGHGIHVAFRPPDIGLA